MYECQVIGLCDGEYVVLNYDTGNVVPVLCFWDESHRLVKMTARLGTNGKKRTAMAKDAYTCLNNLFPESNMSGNMLRPSLPTDCMGYTGDKFRVMPDSSGVTVEVLFKRDEDRFVRVPFGLFSSNTPPFWWGYGKTGNVWNVYMCCGFSDVVRLMFYKNYAMLNRVRSLPYLTERQLKGGWHV